MPQKGLVASYDCLQDELAASKNTLEEYLDDLRRVMRVVNLKFVHTKERYEIEVPEDQEKKNPSNFIFTSKRAGFSRYVTPESRKLVAEVESIE